MNYLPAQLTGTFARSKNLIRATRDFDRGRCTRPELEKVRREDVKEIVSLQKGFEFITDGNLLWQDLFRPFTIVPGIRIGPLTRFFETNTFYRRPVIVGEIDFNPRKIDRFFDFDLLPTNRKVVLPGPLTFCKMSEDLYHKKNYLMKVADMLGSVVRHLTQNNVKAIQFSEPFLAHGKGNLSKRDISQVKDAYGVIAANSERAEISIHTYFGDFSAISYALQFPIDAVTIDLTATNIEKLKFETGKRIGLGCIDATNSLLENTRDTFKLVKKIVKRMQLKDFYLCPNSDLDFLPFLIARKKIEILRLLANEFK